jgi:ribonuclease PH
MRPDGRQADQLRDVRIATGVQRDPHGSAQVTFGNTVVLCAATVSERVPEWLAGKGRGWITAEYAMLPGAVRGRAPRAQKGRSEEIQRLVGRSLRAAVDLGAMPDLAITVDCDVLQADAGTRCASITGGWVALSLAFRRLVAEGRLPASPMRHALCAVSCALVDGVAVLDPDYAEDHRADVDANFVIAEGGRLVEVQATAEGAPFDDGALATMLTLAHGAAPALFRAQQDALRT